MDHNYKDTISAKRPEKVKKGNFTPSDRTGAFTKTLDPMNKELYSFFSQRHILKSFNNQENTFDKIRKAINFEKCNDSEAEKIIKWRLDDGKSLYFNFRIDFLHSPEKNPMCMIVRGVKVTEEGQESSMLIEITPDGEDMDLFHKYRDAIRK